MKPDLVRTVVLTPYAKGQGPTFRLSLFDVHATDSAGRHGVGYRLTCKRNGESMVLFDCQDAQGAAFGHHSVDGDEAVKNVMGWLTLKPGDTDSDYFKDYTATQLEYCRSYAEALAVEVYARFGEP